MSVERTRTRPWLSTRVARGLRFFSGFHWVVPGPFEMDGLIWVIGGCTGLERVIEGSTGLKWVLMDSNGTWFKWVRLG